MLTEQQKARMHPYIDRLWRMSAGKPELINRKVDEAILKHDIEKHVEKLVQLMENRLVASAQKYGELNCAESKQLDRVQSMIDRLHYYWETRNKEVMVDIINIALILYMYDDHEDCHFEATDSTFTM